MILMIALVVLAAGKSERYGRNKLLEKIGDKTIIRKVVEESLRSKADRVFVVVGFEADRIIDELRDLKVTFVYNVNYEEGMSSSVKAGVLAAKTYNAKAVAILPADNLLITHGVIDKVIEKFKETHAKIVVPSYKGKRGHPILLNMEIYYDIMSISEETQGLKYVVRKYRDEIVEVPVNSPEIYIDVDTPEDLEKLRNLGLIK
ncbi:MAG: nucleotidyl transferase [Desulfurococcales archaeon ex4484_217_2]|nr:MAG: nucleotidyl transferase [Desulfurococcales archaeon ex4484_217_2]